jgi:hypothetical protein
LKSIERCKDSARTRKTFPALRVRAAHWPPKERINPSAGQRCPRNRAKDAFRQ